MEVKKQIVRSHFDVSSLRRPRSAKLSRLGLRPVGQPGITLACIHDATAIIVRSRLNKMAWRGRHSSFSGI
jgi:hypothetical protein